MVFFPLVHLRMTCSRPYIGSYDLAARILLLEGKHFGQSWNLSKPFQPESSSAERLSACCNSGPINRRGYRSSLRERLAGKGFEDVASPTTARPTKRKRAADRPAG